MHYSTFCVFIISIFCACDRNTDPLSTALNTAGDNRAELEKVINHYSKNPKDSLKLQSAKFLITHMEGKYSYQGAQLNSFYYFLDSLLGQPATTDVYKSELNKYYQENHTLVGRPDAVFDLQQISADLLIQNIDQAVDIFYTTPWHSQYSKEFFFEYVLPYRIANEHAENFRQSFRNEYAKFIGQNPIDVSQAVQTILDETVKHPMEIMVFPGYVPSYPPSLLKRILGGTCTESSYLSIYILRSLGIPVAHDFTPQWPNRKNGHSWSALILDKTRSVDFEGATSNKIGNHLLSSPNTHVAKVYRKTYSRQTHSLALRNNGEPIPDFFKDPCFIDVSSSYFRGTTIKIQIPDSLSTKKQFAYLCVFNNENWVPIHWAEIKDKSAVFSGMGTSVVYLPAVYDVGKIRPIGNPILLDSTGHYQEIISKKNHRQTLVLNRKYPVFDWWNTRNQAMLGGKIQASNSADFSKAIDVYTIKRIPEMTYQTIEVHTGKKYKYWRYMAPDSTQGDIAELEFYEGTDRIFPERILGTTQIDRTNKPENVFDNDPLTYFQGSKTADNWVGVGFDSGRRITRIRYLCRNDDNFIREKDAYELYHWQAGNWVSLGKKNGDTSQRLTFSGVPVNALFLLKNHSRGQEERIFAYAQGKQIWW